MIDAIGLATTVGKRNRALLLLLATTGMRNKELCRLKLEVVTWRTGGGIFGQPRVSGNIAYHCWMTSIGHSPLEHFLALSGTAILAGRSRANWHRLLVLSRDLTRLVHWHLQGIDLQTRLPIVATELCHVRDRHITYFVAGTAD